MTPTESVISQSCTQIISDDTVVFRAKVGVMRYSGILIAEGDEAFDICRLLQTTYRNELKRMRRWHGRDIDNEQDDLYHHIERNASGLKVRLFNYGTGIPGLQFDNRGAHAIWDAHCQAVRMMKVHTEAHLQSPVMAVSGAVFGALKETQGAH